MEDEPEMEMDWVRAHSESFLCDNMEEDSRHVIIADKSYYESLDMMYWMRSAVYHDNSAEERGPVTRTRIFQHLNYEFTVQTRVSWRLYH